MRAPTQRTGADLPPAVPAGSLLGQALATQRDVGSEAPEYLRILSKIEAAAGVGLKFDTVLAGIDSGSINEAARQLLHAVVVAAMASTAAPRFPELHAASAARYEQLFAALRTLGAHFGVRKFPPVEIPAHGHGLDDVDIDAELHRAMEVYRVAEGVVEAAFQDPRSQALLAKVLYKAEEAPALLIAMWKHLSVEMHAIQGSLIEPGLGRKRVTRADRSAFILRLDAAMTTVLGRGDVRFLTAMTNALFDDLGAEGTSEDAIRKFLKRALDRKG